MDTSVGTEKMIRVKTDPETPVSALLPHNDFDPIEETVETPEIGNFVPKGHLDPRTTVLEDTVAALRYPLIIHTTSNRKAEGNNPLYYNLGAPPDEVVSLTGVGLPVIAVTERPKKYSDQSNASNRRSAINKR